MQVITKNLNPQLLAGSVGLLQTAIPELNPKNLIEALTGYGEGSKPAEKLLTFGQVASMYGVSRMTICRMVDRGELPRVKVGKRSVRIPLSAAKHLMEA